jgi:hypothetical protein
LSQRADVPLAIVKASSDLAGGLLLLDGAIVQGWLRSDP